MIIKAIIINIVDSLDPLVGPPSFMSRHATFRDSQLGPKRRSWVFANQERNKERFKIKNIYRDVPFSALVLSGL